MPPSQLKQLKASLREHGVLGPQKSKKQRKATAKDATKRLQRNAALEGIRERFNPFEAKAPSRKEKFEVATSRPTKKSIGRPGVTKGLGEERRRDTLLKEIQSRNKVGGMLDRRFGENDPTMSLEEKAAERFARQSMRNTKKNSTFNLEEDSEEDLVLTHGGMSLDFEGHAKDDFAEDISGSEGEHDFEDQDDRPRKRARLDGDAESGDNDDEEMNAGADASGHKKSKNEVMKELIAKSKAYKAERQAVKEDDDDLRAELDKGMGDFYEALQNYQPGTKRQLPSPPTTDTEPIMNPARAAMLAGKSRDEAEKEYEANLRQLKLEARSKPSVRTKTEEEKAAEQAEKLQELERKRVRRMKGEADSSDEEDEEKITDEGVDELDDEVDDAEVFGLVQPEYNVRPELDVEDEDEFVFDDIIASDSEADADSDDPESDSDAETEDDGDDDFINGLVLPKVSDIPSLLTNTKLSKDLAFTFPCPQTHDEFLEVTKGSQLSDLPTIVQRIRALYHKGLAAGNDEKLAKFAGVLLQHIAHLANSDTPDLSYSVIESLIRHLHSMAKAQPEAVGLAMRDLLREIAEQRPLEFLPGDLLVLTAISTIFPTSDHFHPVVTPAMLSIARYLAQSSTQSLQDLARGAYACTLALQYQKLAKRYVPEVVTYLVNAIAILTPAPLSVVGQGKRPLNVPIRLPEKTLRITQAQSTKPTALSFNSLRNSNDPTLTAANILSILLKLCIQASQLWQSKTAFPEIMSPIQQVINHLITHPTNKSIRPKSLLKSASSTYQSIHTLTTTATSLRKPLLLHNHRPLAIKSSIPSFIENYNPDRHYDPDRERASLAKLKAEHKKERKGAMRELRKDANFIAREQLREKKAKDEAYDKKFKRLVAEIQGEEGKEKKEYEREKRKRKGKF